MDRLLQSLRNPLVFKRRFSSVLVKAFRALLILGLCYLFLFPLFYLSLAAFGSPASMEDPSVVWIPKGASLDNFRLAFDTLEFHKSAILSLIITVFSTLAAICSCSLVGYGLARFRFVEKRLAFALVMLMIIVPPQTHLVSSYLQYSHFTFGGLLKLLAPLTGVESVRLTNTPWVFILPAIFASGLRGGLFVFIFRQFFLGLPKDLEEAAHIDGCGAFRTYLRVIVPITRPAFVTVILFSVVWHWNDLYTSSMMFDKINDQVMPLTAMLSSFNENLSVMMGTSDIAQTVQRGAVSAACLLTIVPPLLLYILTQRFFVESVERTGLVG